MRWILIAILGYACLVLQTAVFCPGGLAIPVHGHWMRPDLVLVFGLFMALYFGPAEVFIAGWCLGLAADLAVVSGRLGLQALLFACILAGVSFARSALNRRWVLTQSIVTFAVVLAAHLAWYLASQALAGAELGLLRALEQAALDAGYSALLAPYVIWLMLRLRGPLGITLEPYEL